MTVVPFILGALAVGALIRLALRSRRERRSPLAGWRPGRKSHSNLFGVTGLIAGREVRERLRSRMFRLVSIALLGVIAAAVVIPTIQGGAPRRPTIGYTAGSASFKEQLLLVAHELGMKVTIVPELDTARAMNALQEGRLDALVVGTTKILLKTPLLPNDNSLEARYVRALSRSLGAEHAFAEAGLSARQAGIIARARPVPINSIEPGQRPRTTSETTALLGIILIFIVLTQYLTWTLMGVMEEKASRVIEVLLATVRPLQLLAGKVIGIGTVALAQAAGLVAFALVLAEATGSSLVKGAAPWVVAATLVWLILGYGLYSWVYAAAGSLAERQDQIQSLAIPLSAPLIFGYIVSLTGVSSGSASLLVKVLAYFPPTAPFAMPTLVGFGQANWWQFSISAGLCLASTLAAAALAGRVYGSAVLRTGARVRLRNLTRSLP